jgi:hypothetical protein
MAGSLRAQSSNGYVFFAPGGVTCCGHTETTLQAGVGGEFVFWRGLGIGAEFGAVGASRDFAYSAMGVISPDLSYHFVHKDGARVDPFVTAGYTLMFRSGVANLYNAGGGANYWFHKRLGARLEFRDQVYTSGGTLHYWGFRFGLAFR